jgi:prophage antirepressor-like protein
MEKYDDHGNPYWHCICPFCGKKEAVLFKEGLSRTCRFCGVHWDECITNGRFVEAKGCARILESRITGVVHIPWKFAQNAENSVETESKKEVTEVSETKALQIVKSVEFEGVKFDCYQNEKKEFYGTREQIGMMLEYADPDNAIQHIHNRNKERLDKFSTGVKLSQVEGTRTVTRNITVYSFKGLLEICRYSNQPRANAVMDFLWEVADSIRKTGEYATPEAQSKKADKNDEMTMRRLDIMEKNSNWRRGKLIFEMVNKFSNIMTPESKTVFLTEAAQLVSEHDLKHLLPQATEKWYSATELGNEFGVSAQKIGLISNAHGLKAPEGQSNEYGTWIRSKSEHSPKEVMTWIYYEPGRRWFTEHFKQAKTA